MAKLPISEFLTQRLKEYDSSFELRKGTGFEQLFFKPLQFITQPLRDEADVMQTAQSFRRILLTNDPNAFDEDSVDSLANNLFVYRVEGKKSGGLARVYYKAPVDREWPAGGAIFTGSNGARYLNTSPFSITRAQMGTQIELGLFYYDIAVQAEEFGEDTDLDAGGLVSLDGDPDVISVTNQAAFSGGRNRETNVELIDRVKRSIAVRDLVTGKGFNAILFENFASSLTEIQAVGFGDEEMMRDIVFNTHIGGKIDGYVKTPKVQTATKTFTGLLIDTTRQTKTSRNVQLFGTEPKTLGSPNVDRSNGLYPVVTEVKPAKAARYRSTVDLSGPIDLSVKRYVRIVIDGVDRTVRIAGVAPAQTKRNEIISLINNAFGYDVAFPFGTTFELVSRVSGLESSIKITDPSVGVSAIEEVFGLSSGLEHDFFGDGPIVFEESDQYEINDSDGTIARVVPPISGPFSSGNTTAANTTFTDATAGAFNGISENYILVVNSGPDAGEYRIKGWVDGNTLNLDKKLTTTASGVSYSLRAPSIKDGETVFVTYYFNPLSIDIGKLIKLDADGKQRGVRPGREAQTITDVAFLRVKKIELIDPLTEEPLGEELKGRGGFGVGGFGEGPYGIGSGKDYYLVVNSPHERYSAFEDSYIVIKSDYQGFSFAVEYEYVPEIEELHTFVRSENERVLDGDILMKHFIPAYVSGEIQYRVDSTDASLPDNDTLTALVKDFISIQKSGTTLDFSDIVQFIIRVTDPFDRFGTFIKPFKLSARIHNTDGTTTTVSGNDRLVVPTLSPFPKETRKPLSPRITHWMADEIVLTRLS